METNADIDQIATPDLFEIHQFGNDRRFAQSLARGLALLRAFRPGDGPLGNQELAHRSGISKATVSRLSFTLAQLGYLEHLPALEKYRLGAGVLALGHVANANLPFADAASRSMQQLADKLGALVAMAVPNGSDMLLTHGWTPSQAPSGWIPVGTLMPMQRSAVGLAYLAAASTAELHQLVGTRLAHNEVDRAKIYTEVERARRTLRLKGFVPSFGRWTSKIHAVAVPFRGPQVARPYVFLCGGTSTSIDRTKLVAIVGPQLAEEVSRLNAH